MGRYNSSIEIPQDKMELWNKIRQEHDVAAIADAADVTKQTIYNALRDGKCQAYVLEAIEEYYTTKMESLYDYIQE